MFSLAPKIPLYKSFRRFGKPRLLPLNLTLNVTFRCNSRCATCNIWKKKVDSSFITSHERNMQAKNILKTDQFEKVVRDELTLSEWKKIFQSIGPRKVFWLILSGGEPFLREEIVEVCQLAAKYLKPKIIHDLKKHVNESSRSVVFAPLGTGGHLDHLLVRDSCLEAFLGNPCVLVVLYSDVPYSLHFPLDEVFLKKKRQIGSWYNELLADVPFIELPLRRDHGAENIYWVYTVVLKDDFGHDAGWVMKKLGERKIGTRPFFYPMHEQPVFRQMGLFGGLQLPVSERIARRGFYLPSGLALTRDQAQRVARELEDAVSGIVRQ